MKALTLLAMLLLAAPLGAQVTGLAGVNDYTVTTTGTVGTLACGASSLPGGTPGSTSGTAGTTFLFDLSAGGVVTFAVDGAPGSFAAAILWKPGPCVPGFVLTNVTGYPIALACCGTNQTFDMGFIPLPTILASGATDSAGDFVVVVPVPPLVLFCGTLCTQAIIIDPAATPSGYLFTQAYDITIL